MSADTRAAEAARRGNIREAIRCLFDESGVDPARRPTFFVDRINAWTSDGALGGALASDRRLHEAVLEVYRRARIDVPDAVYRLFASGESAIGVAVFPVVVMDGRQHRGALRAIEVSVDARAPRHTIKDDSFVRAVEHARRAALARCGANAKVRVRDAHWRILPDLSSNADLGDGSAALAAFVAFVSFALGEPVPANYAFTGVLERRSFHAPSAVTFDEKLRATRERPSITTLFCPAWPGPSEGLVEREPRTSQILAHVFDHPWEDLADRLVAKRGWSGTARRAALVLGGLVVTSASGWWIATRAQSRTELEMSSVERTISAVESPSSSTSGALDALVRPPADVASSADAAADDAGHPTLVGATARGNRTMSAAGAARASGVALPVASFARSPSSEASAEHERAVWGKVKLRDGRGCLTELDLHDQNEAEAERRSTDPKSRLAYHRAYCLMLVGQCDAGRTLFRRVDDIQVGLYLSSQARDSRVHDAVATYCEESGLSRRDEIQRARTRLMNGGNIDAVVPAATCRKAFDTLKAFDAFTGDPSSSDPMKVSALILQDPAARCFARAGDCAGAYRAYEELYSTALSSGAGSPDKETVRRNFEIVAPTCKGRE